MPQKTSTPPTDTLPVPGLLAGELAAAMRCTPRTLVAWERKGKLPPSIRVGRKRVWRRSDVAHLLDNQAGGAQ